MSFVVVIPARYASSRLPGKPLVVINGLPMLQHVHRRATESAAAESVIATDDKRIAEAAQRFGASVCMTRATHTSGTERIAEVADLLDWDDDRVVVNLQGDEPAMPPVLLDECAALLDDPAVDIGTLASPFASQEDFLNPNAVKVVTDASGNALYFSRSPIPYDRANDSALRAATLARHHHGVYAYRCGVLRQLVERAPSDLERCEQLEQLRALDEGMTIRVATPTLRPGTGVDTPEDVARASQALEDFSD